MPLDRKAKYPVLAYLRTSSAANTEGDSAARQRAAISNYARAAGYKVVGEYYDAAVSGADHVEVRPGFTEMLARLDADGIRLVMVEDISRFGRTVAVQELGLALMARRGVHVLAANGDELTDTDDEARVMIRHVLGAFAQMEKTRLVKKLRGARDRMRDATGRCEGRKPVLVGPALAALRRLARKNPRTGQRRSLRALVAALATEKHCNPATGRPYSPETIRAALADVANGTGRAAKQSTRGQAQVAPRSAAGQ